jgi:hypothetical protein
LQILNFQCRLRFEVPVTNSLQTPQELQIGGAGTARLRRPWPASFVFDAATAIASRANVRDDREAPLFVGAGRREALKMICPTAKANYFSIGVWTEGRTEKASDLPVGQIT